MHEAARGAPKELIQAFAEAGASVTTGDKVGVTPLHVAAMHFGQSVLNTLIELGASVRPNILVDCWDQRPENKWFFAIYLTHAVCGQYAHRAGRLGTRLATPCCPCEGLFEAS